ncbi:MAG: DUF721 domain-containing protein [Kiritimatiellia bacterium]|jgi:predicted nucleic acid-binding Zn ribbon protein
MSLRRSLPKDFDFTRWQVERERCQIEDPLPRPPFKEAVPISEILGDVFEKLGITCSVDENRIQADWVAIVGSDLARRTIPGALTDGVLAVYVAGSAWLAELKRAGARNLVAKINAHFGKKTVREISFRAAPSGYRPNPR